MAVTNKVATDIAVKRLSGKAHTNANFGLGSEPYGSTVQTLAEAVFAETLPNDPAQTLWLIQSSSVSDPGTVMWVELDVVPFGSEYQNTTNADAGDLADQGEGGADTYHAYALVLSSSFDTNVVEATFNSNASTDTTWGSFPFVGDSYATGSRGKLQIVPEFASNIPAGVPISDNPYTPKLYGTDGSYIGILNGIDYYVDTYSGILFVQDPADYGTAGSPNIAATVPGKVLAFIYVGKFQDAVTFGAGDVNFIVSGSDEGFAVGNDDTINFVSGSAGITVESNSSAGTITIGESTDNVTFNNITATGDIIAQNYIVSSSVTYMTQSFSSGSTIFGDTDNDTHEFTGSISILHTGSGYGFQMSGSNFSIDWGNSGSVTLGEYNVGSEVAAGFPITGSGLIISQSFTNEATHHNMVKIGETELVDISGSAVSDSFLINVRNKSIIISSSDLSKPVAQFQNDGVNGNILYTGTTKAFEANSGGVSLSSPGPITITPTTDLSIKVAEGTPGTVSHIPAFLTSPTSAPAEVNHFDASDFFREIGGAVTASAVSSSGLLFANASDANGGANIEVAMYNTVTGQFYYTGSSALGDTTELEASASAGIYISASEGTGFSLGLIQSASFTSGAGEGLTVTAGAGNNIEFELVGVLSSSQQIATDISGAIDAATGSLLTDYGLLSSSAQIATDISGAIGAATASLSASIVGTANEVEVVGTLGGNITIGLPDDVIIAGNLTVQGTTTTIETDNLLVEDSFIQLASGSGTTGNGGIIVERATDNTGTALFWDETNDVWAVDLAGANAPANTATTDASVVFVSHSSANPTGTPLMGAGDWRLGQMYIATTDNDNDGNNIWIYA